MLTTDTVLHIARLARLKLTKVEAAAFSTQLSAVLDNFNEIAKVDTSGIEPLVTPTDMAFFIREDAVVPQSGQATTDELLQNAPEKSGHLFKVPPVV